MSDIELRGETLRLGYGPRAVLDGVDITVPPRAVTALIGPNGCGKSTLLRALARQLAPQAGGVLLGERPVGDWSAKEFARQVAILAQAPESPDGITVTDLVWFGRHPHQGLLGRRSRADAAAVAAAMTATTIADLADRPLATLSGGQRQRAWIAMNLAQDSPILLLDEPTTFLDPAHQLEVLELIRRVNGPAGGGRTVAMVLHDIGQAMRYADQVVVLADGGIVAHGPTEEVLTAALVRQVFGVDCLTTTDPDTGRTLLVPWRPVADRAPAHPATDPEPANDLTP